MTRKRKLLRFVPLAIAGFAAFVALGGAVVMLLWNGLMPAIFGLPQVTFWQALGLLALSRILFGGSGWRGHARSHVRRQVGERCGRMSTEERERFRQGMGERLGFGAWMDENQGENKEL